jgi:Ca-activated chloride channel family protein
MPDVLTYLVGEFHFIRPWLLLGIPGGLLLFWLARLREAGARRWKGIIDSHLLEHLLVSSGRRNRFQPAHAVALLIALGSIGAAGPTWAREETPFTEDLSPLVIAMDLSPSMDAIDVAPTRLERSKQKVLDLLQLRRNARTGLLVYAGSAHVVLPFTDDPSVLSEYVASLRTDIMPVSGDDASAALAVAVEMLARDTVPGTILFLTDGIGTEHTEAFRAHGEESRDQVLVLAIGTREGGPIRTGENQFLTDAGGGRAIARLDEDGLTALRSEAGVDVASSTVDDDDVRRVQRRSQSHLAATRARDGGSRWKDEGWWLVIPVALLALVMLRRGWTVQWGVVLVLFYATGCAPNPTDEPTAPGSEPGVERGGWFLDPWLTPDQQGRRLMEQGRYAEAAERFEDAAWKGAAHYRAGNMDDAISWFARRDSPEAAYNLGNAYALLGEYETAVASYEQALEARPDWDEARANRDLVASLIPPPPEEGQAPPERNDDPSFDPDEVRVDEEQEGGSPGEVPLEQLSPEDIEAMWLRGLQSSPADFLRNRFFLERARNGSDG